jgi:hypothetical protein
MALRMVRCRAGRSRPPPVNSGSRCCNRARSAGGGRILTRAAANSIASGKPSRCRQMAATASAVSAVSAKSGCTARALQKERHGGTLCQVLNHWEVVKGG